MCFFLHMWISALTAYSMRFSMQFHADVRLSMYINKNVYALMEQNAWPILTYCPTKIWIIFRIWKRWTRYVFSQKTRAPAKKAEPIMWNPEKRGAWCHSVHFRSNSHKFPAKLDGHWPGAAPPSNLYQFNVKFLRCSSTGGKSGLSVAGAAASH